MPGDRHRGAYGFRLVLDDPEVELPSLLPVSPEADPVTLVCRHASAVADDLRVAPDEVVMSRSGASRMEVSQRPERRIVLDQHEDLQPGALTHPMLTTPLSVLARWRGNATLHAGAVLLGGHAWGIAGDREAGKSSMLAELTRDGTPLVADDLVVVDGRDVLSGPGCIDLRPGAAERYGATSLGIVSLRERFRVLRSPAPERVPLGGFFHLVWRDQPEPTVEPLGLKERLAFLYDQDYTGFLAPADPASVMDLLDVPMWRLARPQRWEGADAAAQRLRATVAEALGLAPGEL